MPNPSGQHSPPYFERTGFRWDTGVAGTVLLALGVGLLWLASDHGWAKAALCALLATLGVNALCCALNAVEP